jgi:hypothetical protein
LWSFGTVFYFHPCRSQNWIEIGLNLRYVEEEDFWNPIVVPARDFDFSWWRKLALNLTSFGYLTCKIGIVPILSGDHCTYSTSLDRAPPRSHKASEITRVPDQITESQAATAFCPSQ